MVSRGPDRCQSFRLYVEKVLLPRGQGSHRGKIVRQLIRSAGAKLFLLPKYSPDLNPIEQVFAKLKHFLRRAAARTVEAVCSAIGEVLQLFTSEECASYLANSGYRRT
jgi:transposase